MYEQDSLPFAGQPGQINISWISVAHSYLVLPEKPFFPSDMGTTLVPGVRSSEINI